MGASEATALLDLAITESQAPVGELGDSLERMSRALAQCRHLAQAHHDDSLNPELIRTLKLCRDTFEREVARCIESLQFHDRLIQQLTHARDCLNALGGSDSGASDVWANRHAAEGSIELF